MITFTYLTTQKVLDYSLEYPSILHVKKLSQVHLEGSTKHNYYGVLQFDLVFMYFYSR